jgi:hypothetical protein
MNLERASERAYSVRGRWSAARLYNDIEYELALGEPGPHSETAGEQALALLENRFPGVREAARQIEEPPSLSRRAGDALHGVRRQSPRPGPPARHRRHHRATPARRSWIRSYRHARAHPLPAAAIATLSVIVIVHFWADITVGVIALAALKAYGVGRR